VFDADGPEIKQGKLVTLELLAEARAIYSQENFAETPRLFSECWRHNQGDRAAKIYWERCQPALVTRTKIKDWPHNLDSLQQSQTRSLHYYSASPWWLWEWASGESWRPRSARELSPAIADVEGFSYLEERENTIGGNDLSD
jgi:hypothetical protein